MGAACVNDLKMNAVLYVNGTVDGRYQRDEPAWGVFFFAWEDA